MAGTKLSFASIVVFGLALAPLAASEPSDISAAEFKRLFDELNVKNQRWTGIPWKTSVTEARKAAARERKPIFFNVNTGNCLGFT